jgi:hypothetical protein
LKLILTVNNQWTTILGPKLNIWCSTVPSL